MFVFVVLSRQFTCISSVHEKEGRGRKERRERRDRKGQEGENGRRERSKRRDEVKRR